METFNVYLEDLFEQLEIKKNDGVKIEDYIVYKIDDFNTLVVFPYNLLQEKWEETPYIDVIKQIENKTYLMWKPKITYEFLPTEEEDNYDGDYNTL